MITDVVARHLAGQYQTYIVVITAVHSLGRMIHEAQYLAAGVRRGAAQRNVFMILTTCAHIELVLADQPISRFIVPLGVSNLCLECLG